MTQNSDGKLSAAELKPALQSIGFNPTNETVRRLMAAADLDGDGYIEYESGEFAKLIDELEDDSDEQVLRAFKTLDKNGDGLISVQELRQVDLSLSLFLSPDILPRIFETPDIVPAYYSLQTICSIRLSLRCFYFFSCERMLPCPCLSLS